MGLSLPSAPSAPPGSEQAEAEQHIESSGSLPCSLGVPGLLRLLGPLSQKASARLTEPWHCSALCPQPAFCCCLDSGEPVLLVSPWGAAEGLFSQ